MKIIIYLNWNRTDNHCLQLNAAPLQPPILSIYTNEITIHYEEKPSYHKYISVSQRNRKVKWNSSSHNTSYCTYEYGVSLERASEFWLSKTSIQHLGSNTFYQDMTEPGNIEKRLQILNYVYSGPQATIYCTEILRVGQYWSFLLTIFVPKNMFLVIDMALLTYNSEIIFVIVKYIYKLHLKN